MKPMNEKHFAILRRHMVEIIGIHADIIEDELGKPALDERVLTAMLRVPRHLFVLEPLARLAYEDRPLPIGFEKTISQRTVADDVGSTSRMRSCASRRGRRCMPRWLEYP